MRSATIVTSIIVVLFLVAGLLIGSPRFTGFFSFDEAEYSTITLNKTITSTSEISVPVDSPINSFLLNGLLTGEGNVTIELKNGTNSWLVYERVQEIGSGNLITGNVVGVIEKGDNSEEIAQDTEIEDEIQELQESDTQDEENQEFDEDDQEVSENNDSDEDVEDEVLKDDTQVEATQNQTNETDDINVSIHISLEEDVDISEAHNDTNITDGIDKNISLNITSNQSINDTNVTVNETNQTIDIGNLTSNVSLNVSENLTTVTLNQTVNITLNVTSNENITRNQTQNTTVLHQSNNQTLHETLNKTNLSITQSEITASVNKTILENVAVNITLNNQTNQSNYTTVLPQINYTILAKECDDTCAFLPTGNLSLQITIEGNVSLLLTSAQIKYIPIFYQHTNISDITIGLNQSLSIDVADYFEGDGIYYDLPRLSIEAELKGSNLTLYSGEREGWYEVYVFAVREQELLRTNVFRVFAITNYTPNQEINLSLLEQLNSTILDALNEDGNVRVLLKETKQGDVVDFESLSEDQIEEVEKDLELKENTKGLEILEEKKKAKIQNSTSNRTKKFLATKTNKTVLIEQQVENIVAVEVNATQLAQLVQEGNNEIELDVPLSFFGVKSSEITRTDSVHTLGYTGVGSSLCLVDSGSNLAVSQGINVVDGSTNITDIFFHGTAVHSIVSTFAPNVSVYVAKVVGDDGSIFTSDVLAGMEWCKEQNASVVSLSLGEGNYQNYCDGTLLASKVNELSQEGIYVVVATGNDGSTSGIANPSCATKAIRVSGSTKDDEIWTQANRNNLTLLVAPAMDIITPVGIYSGTSMSTPMVSAAISLLDNAIDLSLLNETVHEYLIHTGEIIVADERSYTRLHTYNALTGNITNNLTFGEVYEEVIQETNLTLFAAPTVLNVSVSPDFAVGAESFGMCTASDADGDAVSYEYRLYEDGIIIDSGFDGFSQVDAGRYHTCALLRNGTPMCWGENFYRQIGYSDTTTDFFSPVVVPTDINFTSISAGEWHTCGIAINGTGYCWGLSNNGRLGAGDGLSGSYATPQAINMSEPWIQIDAQWDKTCGVIANGTGYCWGFEAYCDHGDGSCNDDNTNPSQVTGSYNFTMIKGGLYHACGLLTNGSIVCWGRDDQGQVGNGAPTNNYGSPEPVAGNYVFKYLDSGRNSNCAVLINGSVACWGDEDFGAMGDGLPLADNNQPTLINSTSRFKNVGSGLHNCGVALNGTGYCWGGDYADALGNGARGDASSPDKVETAALFEHIDASEAHSCGLLRNGSILCWGGDSFGKLGIGQPATNQESPALTNTSEIFMTQGERLYSQAGEEQLFYYINDTVVSGSSSYSLSCRVFDGTSYSEWVGDFIPIVTSVSISTLPLTSSQQNYGLCTATDSNTDMLSYEYEWFVNGTSVDSYSFRDGSLSVGEDHVCALAMNGTPICWGDNTYAQLGIGTSTGQYYSPIPVQTDYNFSMISAGRLHTCGLLTNSSIACWGRDAEGQLGDGGTNTEQTTPTLINSSWKFRYVSAGYSASCAVHENRSAVCWGTETDGELGNGGTDTDSLTNPTLVNTNMLFDSISINLHHTCGVLINGSPSCWGRDSNGQLGLSGDSSDQVSPIVSTTDYLYKKIVNGARHSCGVHIDGRVSCWGLNTAGQTGVGSDNSQAPLPTLINNTELFTDVTAGETLGCAVQVNGTAYCWGQNINGVLGIGINDGGLNYTSPQKVNSSYFYTQIAAGTGVGCGLLSNNTVACWGNDANGQLGIGTVSTNQYSPVLINWTEPLSQGFMNETVAQNTNNLFARLNASYIGPSDSVILSCRAYDGENYSAWVNTSTYISDEGFGLSSVNISPDPANNQSNLTVNFVEEVGTGTVYSAVDWRLNGISIAYLNYPFFEDDLTPSSISTSSVSASSTGSPVWTAGGLDGPLGLPYMNFSGTNDYVTVSSFSAPDKGTVAFWIYISPSTVGGRIIGPGDSYEFRIDPSNKVLRNEFLASGDSGTFYYEDITGSWQYVVATWDADTDISEIYINGSFANSSTQADDTSGSPTTFTIGTRGTNTDDFDGAISSFMLFDRVLSAEQISFMYEGYTNGNDSIYRIVAQETQIGENWSAQIVPFDDNGNGTNRTTSNVTILSNLPPSVSSVNIEPTTAYTYDELFGMCAASDGEDDLLSYEYEWFVNSGGLGSDVWNDYVDLAMGFWHTCAILENGTPSCWGYNNYGGLGDGTNSDSNTPIITNTTQNFTQIDAGVFHTCGLLVNGSVMCWGYDSSGALGNGGSNQNEYNPVFINSTETFIDIGIGNYVGCGVLTNRSIMCWGNDDSGELGNGGGALDSPNPVLVNSTEEFVQVTAGVDFACGLLVNGSIMCWGSDNDGSLGNGATTGDQYSPTLVNTSYTYMYIAAGDDHTCGILNNGSALCWGQDDDGQLGDGMDSNDNQTSPVFVNTTYRFSRISSAGTFTCGLLINGSVSCWGDDTGGYLGNGNILTGEQSSPVLINSSETYVGISSGYTHSCAILENGSAQCWGAESFGELGIGGLGQQNSPENVLTSNSFATSLRNTTLLGDNYLVSSLLSNETSANDDIILSCRAYDGAEYSSWVNSTPITLLTHPPTLEYANISPSLPYRVDDLQANITCADPYFATLTAHWNVYNGTSFVASLSSNTTVSNGVNTNITNISSSFTNPLEDWTIEFWCENDYTVTSRVNRSVTIQNYLPSISGVNMPSVVQPLSDITCTAVGFSDSDGDGDQYYYTWYKNGVLNLTSLSPNNEMTLTSANTSSSDYWTCQVIPYDGYENGSQLNSTTYVLVNITSLVLNSSLGTNLTTENLTVYPNINRESTDSVTNITDWRNNNISIALLHFSFDSNISSLDTATIRDYTHHSTNGTLGNGSASEAPVWEDNCIVGGCYNFTYTQRDMIYFGTMNPDERPGNEFTISSWIKTTQTDSNGGEVISFGDNLQLRIDNFHTSGDDDVALYWYNGTADQVVSSGANDLVNGEWHHIVVRKNSTHIAIFINDTEVNNITTTEVVSYTKSGGTDLYVGRHGNGQSTYDYGGLIDELYVFNYSISEELISSLFQAGSAGTHLETLPFTETTLGDNWSVAVSANDGLNDSEIVVSNNLIILSTPPSVIEVNITPIDLLTTDDVYGFCSATDDNFDALTYEYEWFVNDISISFGNTSIGALSVGELHSCAILTNGTPMCWGDASNGKLGNGVITGNETSPVLVVTDYNFTDISASNSFTCGVLVNGSVACWGSDSNGQLGNGGLTGDQSTPVLVNSTWNFSTVSAHNFYACGLLVNGSIACWGDDAYGKLGNGDIITGNQSNPVLVNSTLSFTKVTTGRDHACAIATDGLVYCWGFDLAGRLGNGAVVASSDYPIQTDVDYRFIDISASIHHTCGILTNGSMACWGYGDNGELGDQMSSSKSSPTIVLNDSLFVSVATSWTSTCGILLNGSVSCVGDGTYGELGSYIQFSYPFISSNTSNRFVRLSGFQNTVCGLLVNGTVQCTGRDQYGQVGDGDDGGANQYYFTTINTSGLFATNLQTAQLPSANDSLLYAHLLSSETSLYDNIILSCRVNDGAEYSSWVNSTTLTILNSVPDLTTVVINTTGIYNLTVDNITISSMDALDYDSDLIHNITDWRVEGVSKALLHVSFDTNTTANISNEIRDYTTYNNYGTLGGGNSTFIPDWTSDCVVGGCYRFNSTERDYVDFGAMNSNITDMNTSTFMAWVRVNTTDSSRSEVISFGNTHHLGITTNGNIQIAQWTGSWLDFASTGQNILNDKWHHIASRKNDTHLSLWINGTEVANTTFTGTLLFDRGTDLVIARHGEGSETYDFDGYLDEVYVYKYAISDQFIDLHYQSGVAGTSVEIIPSSETSVDENWTVAVTVNDLYNESDTVVSNTIMILPLSVVVPLISVENIFVNSSTSHSFNVTAGINNSAGVSLIENVSISSSLGSCTNVANSTIGTFFNTTYSCSGPPFQSSSIQITFCNLAGNCNTTTSSSNSYPNQVPGVVTLNIPVDGNNTLTTRTPFLNWSASVDAENDPVNYTINITNSFCPNYERFNVTTNNHTTDIDLGTDYECASNAYFWSVQACDQWNCSAFSTQFNFSIQDYLAITITNSDVNFSTVQITDSSSTDDGTPSPFIFRNDGNIKANLTNITSTSLWSSVGLDTEYFQFKVNTSAEGTSYTAASSITTYTNMSGTYSGGTIIADLNHSDTSDEVAIDINITVPNSEPSGNKTATIDFVWESVP